MFFVATGTFLFATGMVLARAAFFHRCGSELAWFLLNLD